MGFGNGVLKGNVEGIVGEMQDEVEGEGGKKGEKEVIEGKRKRDCGLEIFYVFMNIGGVMGGFMGRLLRRWWVSGENMVQNGGVGGVCDEYIGKGGEGMWGEGMGKLNELM